MSYDPAKRRRNLRKHKVDLPGCEAAFDAPMLTREDDRQRYGEQRLISLGCGLMGRWWYLYGPTARKAHD